VAALINVLRSTQVLSSVPVSEAEDMCRKVFNDIQSDLIDPGLVEQMRLARLWVGIRRGINLLLCRWSRGLEDICSDGGPRFLRVS